MQICVVLECVSDVRIRHAFLTPRWTDVVSIRCFSNSGGRAVFERHSNTVHRFCQKSASLFFRTCFSTWNARQMLQTLMFNVFCFFSPLDLAVNFVLAWPVVCSIRPASQHRMDLLRRALQTSQNSSTGAAVSMQGATGDVLETTLDKLTLAGSEDMRILLKSVYYEPYQIKTKDQSRDFTKLVGKVTDKDGNGMYYEVRGKDQQSCERQFQTLLSGKPFFVSRLKVQKKNPYYGHLYADFSERNSRTQFHAMASSHPSSMQMNQVFPVAKSDLSVLKRLGLDKKRVDIIGKVVAMKEQELPSHLKCDLYIKDESDKELRVQLWGETMVQKARTISLGEVVQVDNAILQRQVETGTIAATAEAGKDSKHGFCAWLHISPPEALQALTLERGEAISSAWAGSLSGGSSLRPTTGKSKAIVTCCSTAAACSIVAGESSDVGWRACEVPMWLTGHAKNVKPKWTRRRAFARNTARMVALRSRKTTAQFSPQCTWLIGQGSSTICW